MDVISRVHFSDSNFNVLIGLENGFFPGLMAGVNGCMAASAGIISEVMVAIFNY